MQVETFKAEGQKGIFNQIDLDLERTREFIKFWAIFQVKR